MAVENVKHSFGSEARNTDAFPIDESQYSLDEGTPELEFWKAQTGIKNNEELKQHVLAVQKEAYSLFAYQCIRHFAFLRFRIPLIVGYERLLKLAKNREGAILLDVGCCFGTDTRRAVFDGWPAKNVVTTDIQSDFWRLGHKLFCSTPDSFPATFVPGNALDAEHLAAAPVVYSASEVTTPRPTLSSLTSLNPLRGHVDAIHTGAFFHLFDEAQVSQIAHAFGGLLSPEPGSMIIGSQGGALEKGVKVVLEGDDGSTVSQFRHSPESWKQLWDGEIFKKGTVHVEVEMKFTAAGTEGRKTDRYAMYWSVTRL